MSVCYAWVKKYCWPSTRGQYPPIIYHLIPRGASIYLEFSLGLEPIPTAAIDRSWQDQHTKTDKTILTTLSISSSNSKNTSLFWEEETPHIKKDLRTSQGFELPEVSSRGTLVSAVVLCGGVNPCTIVPPEQQFVNCSGLWRHVNRSINNVVYDMSLFTFSYR